MLMIRSLILLFTFFRCSPPNSREGKFVGIGKTDAEEKKEEKAFACGVDDLCIPKCCDINEFYNIDSEACERRRKNDNEEGGEADSSSSFDMEIFNKNYPHSRLSASQRPKREAWIDGKPE